MARSSDRPPLRHVVAALVALTSVALVGCTDAEPDAVPTDSCRSLVDEAAGEAELSDQVEVLDRALAVCRSYEQFERELNEHPSLLGFDVNTYVTRRCTTPDAGDVANSTICTSTVTTTTVGPAPTIPEVVYVGQTLDGRQVEIRPDDTTEFVDGNPAPIVLIVDIANEDGCPGVIAERNRWEAFVDDPVIGDEASVYAQHAINVMALLGCDSP